MITKRHLTKRNMLVSFSRSHTSPKPTSVGVFGQLVGATVKRTVIVAFSAIILLTGNAGHSETLLFDDGFEHVEEVMDLFQADGSRWHNFTLSGLGRRCPRLFHRLPG